MKSPPLIAHVVFRLDVGGLENGLVNLINELPQSSYRHAVVCLTEHTDFRERIIRPDVELVALHKKPGKDLGVYQRLWRWLRHRRPAVLHTRNIGTLDCVLPARLAGVRHFVHGEHGRSMEDPHGHSGKQIRLRRFHQPLVHRFIAVSLDLAHWLQQTVGVPGEKVCQIYNGVDAYKFRSDPKRPRVTPFGGGDNAHFVIGTVGRMDPVKSPTLLVESFLRLITQIPNGRDRFRFVYVGDGPLYPEVKRRLAEQGALDLAWLPGFRSDVADVLRSLDLFVLPSMAEGISNTLLEAMATQLPVVATQVGGNEELVEHGVTGTLVAAGDSMALAQAMESYAERPEQGRAHGHAARERAKARFSLDAMTTGYDAVYRQVLGTYQA